MAGTTRLEVRELESDEEILAAFPLMAELRERVRVETFVGEVRRQQKDGYRLVGGFDGERLVALAGIRVAHTLSRGAHLFVDDLVTTAEGRGRGYGAGMMRAIGERAAREGMARVYLDSRSTARGFYEKVGFTLMTAIPAFIETERLKG